MPRPYNTQNSRSSPSSTSSSSSSPSSYKKREKVAPTGIKAITSLLMPMELWDVNNIRDLRFLGTDGLPPKIEAPHITLLDSFSSSDRFQNAAVKFTRALEHIKPFRVEFKTFKYFTHANGSFTLYLEPEPEGHKQLVQLQRSLHNACFGFTMLEHKLLPHKFTPHMSLGKVGSKDKLDNLIKQYSASWVTVSFEVKEIYLMSKLLHDTVVRHVVPLGSKSAPLSLSPSPPRFEPIPFPPGDQSSININWIPRGATDADLLNLFASHGALSAQVLFKTIQHKDYTKGWGHVIFKDIPTRDAVIAIRDSFALMGSRLELFPCD